MKTHLISLAYVQMAIKRASWLKNTKAMAVSNDRKPLRGRGDDQLHGACVIFQLT